MAVKIPASILKLVNRQKRQLDKVAPAHRRRLLRIGSRAARNLEARLRRLAPDRFSAQETRFVLAQVRPVVAILGAEYGNAMGDEIESIGLSSAAIGRDSLAQQLAAWEQEFPVGGLGRTAPVEVAGSLLDPGLLEHYRTSRETYGLSAIRGMRDAMAQGILQGETLIQTADRMARELRLQPYQAERIVRTEQSLSMHRQQLGDMAEAFGDDVDEWRKTLVTTFDTRTGPDSKFVDGQVRKLDKRFADNQGRRYMTPPNRPNDREVMVMFPDEAA